MKYFDRVARLFLLVSLLVLAAAVQPAQAGPAESHSASVLLQKGIIQGYPGGELGLERFLTRAELAKIIVNLAEAREAAETLSRGSSSFRDIDDGFWAKGSREWEGEISPPAVPSPAARPMWSCPDC